LIAGLTIPSIGLPLMERQRKFVESFSDLLGISANKAIDFLCEAKLIEKHNRHKTMCINKGSWEALIFEFCLEIEREERSDISFLGKRMHVTRIGRLCDDNPIAFTARDQVQRFLKTGWKPKRLRATVQAREFVSKTSLDLTIIMAKRQKELDEKERKERNELDEKEAGDSDGDYESEEEQTLPYETPAKLQSLVTFDMKDAMTEPIKWTSPNGSPNTAIPVPCCGTRHSFRNSANRTGWIQQIIESMYNKEKVLPEVAIEWLIEAIFELHPQEFESFCERKGYLLPKTARMPKDKTAAMWTDANVSYGVQRLINRSTVASTSVDGYLRRRKTFADSETQP
jgi:hypothetical protein